jgi:hypothetical protein
MRLGRNRRAQESVSALLWPLHQCIPLGRQHRHPTSGMGGLPDGIPPTPKGRVPLARERISRLLMMLFTWESMPDAEALTRD